MAQLAVIPGSATAWPGERESGTAALVWERLLHPGAAYTLSRSRGGRAPTAGKGGWVKRSW